jgi:methylenetetrahydrofolate dehydrogenase (NADP+)/methenyltetrahydrofolate cyclohydrolase
MSAASLSGAPVAEAVLASVSARAAALRARGVVPTLATILVGDSADSRAYVQKKHQACAQVGLRSVDAQLPGTASFLELRELIRELNADAAVHGILVQSPLPAPLDFNRVLLEIDPSKDADGLHPESLGRLAMGMPGPVPATPAGIDAMFRHYGIDVAGQHVAIVGRGPTLGRPLALLLSANRPGGNAAVTLLHSRVADWQAFTRQADIVIVGVGQPSILKAVDIKPGAIVVSAGITWQGKKLLPDVDPAVEAVASWMTPRLGGVGVMTIAMLLDNTVSLAEDRFVETGTGDPGIPPR